MLEFSVETVSSEKKAELQQKIDSKTKPIGSLGRLEELALKLGLIQNSLSPVLNKPTILVFAGDHGIAAEGVSAYPQEVTHQMVFNFLTGGAAICVFSRQNNINLKIIDAGVNYDFPSDTELINMKVAKGTKSYISNRAMTREQCVEAIQRGGELVEEVFKNGCNVVGFGEMGIGNTSSAAILMSLICDYPISDCVGKGTGLDDEGVKKKANILKSAINRHVSVLNKEDPLDILSVFGGFEIAMITGAMLKAASLKMVVLIDGFIVTSALLIASKLESKILEYCIFCHESNEAGHKKMLEFLKVKPLINLDMRLGEGTGVALAYPLIESAANFLNNMASFEEANVSKKIE